MSFYCFSALVETEGEKSPTLLLFFCLQTNSQHSRVNMEMCDPRTRPSNRVSMSLVLGKAP